jgi:hypothetical protein
MSPVAFRGAVARSNGRAPRVWVEIGLKSRQMFARAQDDGGCIVLEERSKHRMPCEGNG